MSTVLESKSAAPFNPQSALRVIDNPLGLTIKQALFVQYFIETKSGIQAARLAGYAGDDNTLSSVGVENLRKPAIKSALEAYFESQIIGSNETLAELSVLARIDLESTDKIRASDKIKALELAGKYHKHWDRNETVLAPETVDALSDSIVASMMRLAEARRLEASNAVSVDESEG